MTQPRCQCNIGTVEAKATCPNVAKFRYIMDGKLSDTELCGIHAIEADNSHIVKLHLKTKERV